MKRTGIYILLLFSLTFLACEEVIELDINQSPPQLVIDGILTDEDTTHYVRITKSSEFGSNEAINVTDGLVEVSDELGNVFNYTHNPSGVDSLQGYYFSDQPFAAREYGVYELDVTVEGNNYFALDTLRPISDIDSLTVEIDPMADFFPDNDGMIYQVKLYADEPLETVDFYYFRFYRDSVIEARDQVYVFDDRILNGSLDGLPSPINFREGEMASVEIYSLTRQQFVYFMDLSNLLNNDGGMFSPPPANPRTNIQGGALGLFQVSGIRRASILIEP
ncbi:MAG: DUF4249 domain-containing protein [Bacteroidota bacterium]